MSTDFWTTRRDSTRVQAALKVKCPMPTCLAKPGDECTGTIGRVHLMRVPEAELFEKEA